MKEIKNLIKRTELLNWRNLIHFQPSNLKKLTEENAKRIKNSLIENNFIASFHVWEKEGKYWILDGHHRKEVLHSLENSGYILPEKLPCNIVDVATKEQAAKFLLTYSSEYAHPDKKGISQFILDNDLDFAALDDFLDLRDINLEELQINLEDFNPTDEKDQGKLDEKKSITCPHCEHVFVP